MPEPNPHWVWYGFMSSEMDPNLSYYGELVKLKDGSYRYFEGMDESKNQRHVTTIQAECKLTDAS